MKVLDAAFVQGFIRLCDDGFNQNWHERNGGNLSYRIKDEEIQAVKEALRYDRPWQPIGTSGSGSGRRVFHGVGKRQVLCAM